MTTVPDSFKDLLDRLAYDRTTPVQQQFTFDDVTIYMWNKDTIERSIVSNGVRSATLLKRRKRSAARTTWRFVGGPSQPAGRRGRRVCGMQGWGKFCGVFYPQVAYFVPPCRMALCPAPVPPDDETTAYIVMQYVGRLPQPHRILPRCGRAGNPSTSASCPRHRLACCHGVVALHAADAFGHHVAYAGQARERFGGNVRCARS